MALDPARDASTELPDAIDADPQDDGAPQTDDAAQPPPLESPEQSAVEPPSASTSSSAVSAGDSLASASGSPVVVSADEHGFRIASSREAPQFELELRALVQMDARFYFGNPSDAKHNEFLLRRVRPRLSGTVFGLVDYKVVTDFGEGEIELTDALLDLHPFPWLRLMGGKFSPPLGLERLQSNATMPMAEGALDANLSVSRDVGLQLWGELFGEALLYQVAVMNGVPDGSKGDRDDGQHKDVVARIFVHPLAKIPRLGSLGLGFAASRGRRDGSPDNPSLSRYKTTGQTRLFAYASSESDPEQTSFAHGLHTRLNPHAYYYGHGVGLLAEAVRSRQEIHHGNASAVLSHQAWHVTASYVFNGRNTYDGAKVSRPWNPRAGQLGALEVVGRFDAIQLDPRTFPTFADAWRAAQSGKAMGTTLNWVLTPLLRVVVSYERMTFRGGAGSSKSVGNRPPENALFTRLTLSL